LLRGAPATSPVSSAYQIEDEDHSGMLSRKLLGSGGGLCVPHQQMIKGQLAVNRDNKLAIQDYDFCTEPPQRLGNLWTAAGKRFTRLD
jgi:hypothetical protein